MSRYIELDTAIVAAISAVHDQVTAVDIVTALEEAPTADVVEVVRCKDCVHSDKCELDTVPKEVLWCVKLHSLAHENHYCSYGERREG